MPANYFYKLDSRGDIKVRMYTSIQWLYELRTKLDHVSYNYLHAYQQQQILHVY